MTVAGGVVPSAEWHVEADSGTRRRWRRARCDRRCSGSMPDTRRRSRTPYFLRKPAPGRPATTGRRAGGSTWAIRSSASAPVARFGRLGPGGETSREVSRRFNDQAIGEVRRPVTVVPRVDVKLDPATYVWSLVAPGSRGSPSP